MDSFENSFVFNEKVAHTTAMNFGIFSWKFNQNGQLFDFIYIEISLQDFIERKMDLIAI